MMRSGLAVLAALLLLAFGSGPVRAQEAPAATGPLQALMQENAEAIIKSSRRTIEPAITALRDSGLPGAQAVLEQWQERNLWVRKADNLFVIALPDGDGLAQTDIDTGAPLGPLAKAEATQLRPNAGIRALIAAALVQFQLSDPDPARKQAALTAIARDPSDTHLAPLRGSIETETDPAIRAQKERLERLLTLRFDPDEQARIAAIESFGSDVGVDLRAALNPLLATVRKAVPGPIPEGENVARTLIPGSAELSLAEAQALLVEAGALQAVLTPGRASRGADRQPRRRRGGRHPGCRTRYRGRPLCRLRGAGGRGAVPPAATDAEVAAALEAHSFYETYAEPSPAVAAAAVDALHAIELRLALNQAADLALDALSLASIYFLAAIGLAITFGVMRVITWPMASSS